MNCKELIKSAQDHYNQLAPHVKQRETACILYALLQALKQVEASNVIHLCDKVNENNGINT